MSEEAKDESPKKNTQAQMIKELQAQLEERDSKIAEYETELYDRRSVMDPMNGPGEWCEAYKLHGGELLKNRKGEAVKVQDRKVSICRSKYTKPYRAKGKVPVGEKLPIIVDVPLCEHHARVLLGKKHEKHLIDKKGKTPGEIEKQGTMPEKE